MDPHAHKYKIIFGILGNIIGVCVGLAPTATFYNIYKKKDTQGFSGLPYVVSLVSALIWTLYGLPWVTESAFLVITINVATSAMQICYLTIFLIYAPKKPKRQIMIILAACLMFYTILAILTLTAVPKSKRERTVGSIGVAIGAISYAAPLSVAAMVVRTRSVEFLPIALCVAMFINSTIWTCYGIITRDIFLLLPNGLGVVFGVTQLSLYLYYRNAEPLDDLPKKAKSVNDSVLAMDKVDIKSAEKHDRKPVKGDGAMAKVHIKSAEKPDGKPVKDDGNVQSTVLPSGGTKENLASSSVPSNGAPRPNEPPRSNEPPREEVRLHFTFYAAITRISEFS